MSACALLSRFARCAVSLSCFGPAPDQSQHPSPLERPLPVAPCHQSRADHLQQCPRLMEKVIIVGSIPSWEPHLAFVHSKSVPTSFPAKSSSILVRFSGSAAAYMSSWNPHSCDVSTRHHLHVVSCLPGSLQTRGARCGLLANHLVLSISSSRQLLPLSPPSRQSSARYFSPLRAAL